jgi:predicted DNA-binding transcriptional regulator AlpA
MSPHVSAASVEASGNRAASSPVMLDVEHVAELFDVSTRHIRRLVDAGKFPQPVRLGGCVRWPRHVVDTFVADGCPTIRRPAGRAGK